jgi:hypothetical protein
MRKIHFVVLSAYSVLKLITRLARADLTTWILIAASAINIATIPVIAKTHQWTSIRQTKPWSHLFTASNATANGDDRVHNTGRQAYHLRLTVRAGSMYP